MIKGFTIAAAALAVTLAAATPAQAVRICNPDGTCVSSNGTSTNGVKINGFKMNSIRQNGFVVNGTHTGAPIAHVVPSGSGERAVATFAVSAVSAVSAVTLVDGSVVAVK